MPRQQYSHEQLLVPQNTPLQANRNRNVAVEFFKKKLNEIETKVWHVKGKILSFIYFSPYIFSSRMGF